MRKLLLLHVAILLSIALFAQRISIQPSTLDFRLGPSSLQAQTIDIANYSDKPITFQAYLADWLRDSTGGHRYYKMDTLKRSCASWVRLSKNFFVLPPGSATQVTVQLQAPADSNAFKQMKWAMLFFETVQEQDSARLKEKQLQATVTELMRIGIHIYQTPPTLTTKKAKTISFRSLVGEPNTYELKMHNSGHVMLYCKSYLDLTDVATGKQYKSDVVEYPVFPDGMRKVKLKLPANIPPGKYSALAILDIGEDMPLEALERSIEVKAATTEVRKN